MASSQGSNEDDATFLDHTGPDIPFVPIPGTTGSRSSLVLKPTSSPLSFSQKIDAKGNKYIYVHCTDMTALKKSLTSPEQNPLMVICPSNAGTVPGVSNSELDSEAAGPSEAEELDLSNLRLVFDPDEDIQPPVRKIKQEPPSTYDDVETPPSRYKVAVKEPVVTRSRNKPVKHAEENRKKRGTPKAKDTTETSATPKRPKDDIPDKKTSNRLKIKTETPASKAEPQSHASKKLNSTSALETGTKKMHKTPLKQTETSSRKHERTLTQKTPAQLSETVSDEAEKTPVSVTPTRKLSKRQEALMAKKALSNETHDSPRKSRDSLKVEGSNKSHGIKRSNQLKESHDPPIWSEPVLHTASPGKKNYMILSRNDSDEDGMNIDEDESLQTVLQNLTGLDYESDSDDEQTATGQTPRSAQKRQKEKMVRKDKSQTQTTSERPREHHSDVATSQKTATKFDKHKPIVSSSKNSRDSERTLDPSDQFSDEITVNVAISSPQNDSTTPSEHSLTGAQSPVQSSVPAFHLDCVTGQLVSLDGLEEVPEQSGRLPMDNAELSVEGQLEPMDNAELSVEGQLEVEKVTSTVEEQEPKKKKRKVKSTSLDEDYIDEAGDAKPPQVKKKAAKKVKRELAGSAGEGDWATDDHTMMEPKEKKKRGRPRKYPVVTRPEGYIPGNKRPRGVRRKFSSLYKSVGPIDPTEMSAALVASGEHKDGVEDQDVENKTVSVKHEKPDQEDSTAVPKENIPEEELEAGAAFEIIPDAPPLDDWTLHDGVFLNQDNLFRLLLTSTQPMYERVPDGIKENIYFTFDNSENVRRRREGGKSTFHDDCGVWAYKMSSTKKMEFILEDGRLVFIVKRGGLYCRKTKKVYFPLGVQPHAEDLIIQRKYYATLKRDSKYRKRITWFESYPGADDTLLNMAVAEYLGKFPTEICIHGNSKCSRAEYRRTDKAILMKIAARVQGRKPKDVYQELVLQGAAPRDLKQVQNIKYNVEQNTGEDEPEIAAMMREVYGLEDHGSSSRGRPYMQHDYSGTESHQEPSHTRAIRAHRQPSEDGTSQRMQEAAEVLQQIQATAHILQQQADGQATLIQEGTAVHILQEAMVDQPRQEQDMVYENTDQHLVMAENVEGDQLTYLQGTEDGSNHQIAYIQHGQDEASQVAYVQNPDMTSQGQTLIIIREGSGLAGEESGMYVLQDQLKEESQDSEELVNQEHEDIVSQGEEQGDLLGQAQEGLVDQEHEQLVSQEQEDFVSEEQEQGDSVSQERVVLVSQDQEQQLSSDDQEGIIQEQELTSQQHEQDLNSNEEAHEFVISEQSEMSNHETDEKLIASEQELASQEEELIHQEQDFIHTGSTEEGEEQIVYSHQGVVDGQEVLYAQQGHNEQVLYMEESLDGQQNIIKLEPVVIEDPGTVGSLPEVLQCTGLEGEVVAEEVTGSQVQSVLNILDEQSFIQEVVEEDKTDSPSIVYYR